MLALHFTLHCAGLWILQEPCCICVRRLHVKLIRVQWFLKQYQCLLGKGLILSTHGTIKE